MGWRAVPRQGVVLLVKRQEGVVYYATRHWTSRRWREIQFRISIQSNGVSHETPLEALSIKRKRLQNDGTPCSLFGKYSLGF
jgi:hypothetical protein